MIVRVKRTIVSFWLLEGVDDITNHKIWYNRHQLLMYDIVRMGNGRLIIIGQRTRQRARLPQGHAGSLKLGGIWCTKPFAC